MKEIQILELTDSHLDGYRQLLNRGLTEDEGSFRITPADDAGAPFPTAGTADSFTLGAYAAGALAGVVSFARDGRDREKLRHKGILFRMYVGRAHRGRGIARLLIGTALARAARAAGIEQVNLTVIAGNKNAAALYESFGFKIYGTEPNAIKWKGMYYDEHQMALTIHPAD